jgi:enterochelin esterase-like enzyme
VAPPPTGPTKIESARLRAFARKCARARPTVVDREWALLSEGGLPLVELVLDAPKSSLVTFVWRPKRRVGSPSLFSPVVDLLHGDPSLKPVGRTGVWYRSLLLPRRTRAHYAFSPHPFPGMDADGSAWGRYFSGLTPDPQNPTQLKIPMAVSVVSLPDAPSQPWSTKRGPMKWKAILHRLSSRDLGLSHPIWVYLPPGWKGSGKGHDLIIVFDGEAYRSAVPAPIIIENLVESGRIAPTVLVLIGNARGARERELTYNPKFIRFLTHELLPWLRRTHHIAVDRTRTLLAGSSLGGLTAAYAALRNPELFGNVLAQSGAFQALQWDRPRPDLSVDASLMEEFARAPLQPIRFYLDIGTFEGIPFPGMQMSPLASVRYFRDVLRAKGYPVTYAEFEGGHDYACWNGTFADGVLAIFGTSPRAP